MLQIDHAIKKAAINCQLEVNEPEDNSNQQLYYSIDYHNETGSHQQNIKAPAKYIFENHAGISELWRLLANLIEHENSSAVAGIENTPLQKLEIIIRQIYPSKDTEIKTRHYILQGNCLEVINSRAGVFRDRQTTQIILTLTQQYKIHQLLIREKGNLVGFHTTDRIIQRPTFNIPYLECQLEASVGDEAYSLSIKMGQFEALECIPFIVLEKLEQLLDAENLLNRAFENDLQNKQRAQARERYKYLRNG